MNKVLVAHGDVQKLKEIVRVLHIAGCEIEATNDGGDAFARFFEDQPDVVICAESLPSLVGHNFASMIRSQSPHTAVGIISDTPLDDLPEGAVRLAEGASEEELRAAFPKLFEAPPGSEGENRSTLPVFVRGALKHFQKDNTFLSLLDDHGIERMAEIAELQNRDPGSLVIQEGDFDNGFYLVLEGQCRVILADRGEVARVDAGGFFGEMAMLSDQPRTATVRTSGPSTLLYFSRDLFLPILNDYPGLHDLLSGVATKRREENVWKQLFEDEDVQRTLAELDEHTGEGDAFVPSYDPLVEEAIAEGKGKAAPSVAQDELELQEETPSLDLDDVPVEAPHPPLEEAEPLESSEKPNDPSAATGAAGVGDSIGDALAQWTGGEQRNPDEEDKESELPSVEHLARSFPSAWSWRFPSGVVLGAALGFLAGVMWGLGADPQPFVSSLPHGEPAESAQADDTPQGLPVDATPTMGDDVAADTDTPINEPTDESTTEEPGQPATPHTTVVDEPPAAPSLPQTKVATPDSGAPAVAPLSDARRKEIRKAFFEAVKARRFSSAVKYAERLQAARAMDWETELYFSEALNKVGRTQEAVDVARLFARKYPTNVYADDALYRAAKMLLTLGRQDQAKKLFQRVATYPDGNLHDSAKQKLKELSP